MVLQRILDQILEQAIEQHPIASRPAVRAEGSFDSDELGLRAQDLAGLLETGAEIHRLELWRSDPDPRIVEQALDHHRQFARARLDEAEITKRAPVRLRAQRADQNLRELRHMTQGRAQIVGDHGREALQFTVGDGEVVRPLAQFA